MPKKSYEVKLRRARLVMGWVTIFRGSTIPLFSRQLRPTQPDHPSVGTGDGFGHQWGRNGEFCVAVGHFTRSAGIIINVIVSVYLWMSNAVIQYFSKLKC